MKKNSINAVNDIIKKIDAMNKSNEYNTKSCIKAMEIYKTYANDLTIAVSTLCKSLIDRQKQDKAICIKAVSFETKNESAIGNDIFAGVQIV